MLILLEGPDCAGKSTLARTLRETIQRAEPNATIHVYHRNPPEAHPFKEYVEPLLNYRPGTGTHIICDRWHLGEVVYPSVLNRPTELTPAVLAYIEKFLRARGALLVHCTAPIDYLHDCGRSRGDDVVEIARAARVRSSFEFAVINSNLAQVCYDVTENVTSQDIDPVLQIIGLANDEEWIAEDLRPFTTYVGPAAPLLLLLGDRRGPDDRPLSDYQDWPAFVPWAATSGRYLFDTLTREQLTVSKHRIQLREIGIANACDVDNPLELWLALGSPVTVALGGNAAIRLGDAGVPHRSVQHPQYRRRFLHDQHADYLIDLLGLPDTELT